MVSETLNSFFKSTVFSYSNKIVFLVQGLLYTYLIANFLGPERYGLVMFILALVGNIVFLFGCEVSSKLTIVFTTKLKSEKLLFLIAAFLYAIFFSVFLFFILFPGQIIQWIGKGSAPLIRLAALLFLLFPSYFLFQSILIGFKNFGKILKVSVFEATSNLLFAFLFVIMFGLGISGVIYAKIISLAVALFFLIYYLKKVPFENKKINFDEIKKYLKGSFLHNTFKKLNNQIILVLMGLFIGVKSLGFYYIIEKITSYFIQVPLSALNDVVLPFASERADSKEKLSTLVSLNIKFLIIAVLLFGIFISVIGKIFLDLFFSSYSDGYFLIPLFVLVNFGTVIMPLSSAYNAINRTDILAKQSYILIISTLSLGFFLISSLGLLGLMAIQIINNSISFVYFYWKHRSVGLRIEVIPRRKDINFFYNSFRQLVLRKIVRK